MRSFSAFFIALVLFSVAISVDVFFVGKDKEREEVSEARIELTQPETTPIPEDVLSQIPQEKLLGPMTHDYQRWNNCGPVTAAMTVSFFGVSQTQAQAASWLKPNPDDKHVSGEEMIWYLESFNLKGQVRVGGTIEIVEQLLANNVPVIVYNLLNDKEDIGHYRAMRGYDNQKQVLISNDSYYGPSRELTFPQFLKLWKPFNYKFIPVWRPEDEEKVKKILGDFADDKKMYENALSISEKELAATPNDSFALLNKAENLLGLERFQGAKESFEKAQSIGLPRRTLWYITWPVKIYRELGEHDKVFELSEQVFASGARLSSEYYLERGLSYVVMGQKEKAKEEFNLALSYQPNYRFAKEELSKI